MEFAEVIKCDRLVRATFVTAEEVEDKTAALAHLEGFSAIMTLGFGYVSHTDLILIDSPFYDRTMAGSLRPLPVPLP
jgi:hypothetical protein